MNYNKLKVVDLKKILTERGLTTKGLKADLIKRLEEDDLVKQSENVKDSEQNSTEDIQESNIQENELMNEIPVEKNTVISEEKKIDKLKDQPIPIPQDEINQQLTTADNELKDKKEPINESNLLKKSNSEIISEENITDNSEEKKKENSDKNNRLEGEIKEEIQKDNKTSQKQNEDNQVQPNIPQNEKMTNENVKTNDEKESTPQIHIAGTSHKEVEKNNSNNEIEINSKKRQINSEEDIDTSSKRKKTDSSSPVESSKSKSPQNTILINNFVRPLVTRTVKELVAQYGEVKSFWMDTIKTHAFVTYETIESAEAAFKGIDGIKFPEETGKILSVEFLSEEESQERIKKEEEKKLGINISGVGSKSHNSAPIRGRYGSLFASSTTAARIGIPLNTGKLSHRKSDTSPFSASPTTISPSSIARAASQSIEIIGRNRENSDSKKTRASPVRETYASFEVDKPVKSRVSSRFKSSKDTTEVSFLHNDKESSNKSTSSLAEEKKKKPTMDDLFKKTKATPTIYYRPLTSEEVKQKEQRENEEKIRSREKEKERERDNKRTRRY